jgi:hypothetical protein
MRQLVLNHVLLSLEQVTNRLNCAFFFFYE